jgi:uncharacterized membrane protein
VTQNGGVSAFEIVQWVLRAIVAAIFVVMGVNHFRPTTARGMAAMVPPWFKRGGVLTGKNLVRFTGVCEVAGGIGILVPWTAFAAGLLLVLFLIAVFPANAYAAANKERFGAAAFPFWPRFVAQLLLIAVILVAIVPA